MTGYAARAEFLPFSRPTIESEEIAEVVDSMRSGWITTGPKVARFEAMFREHLGVSEAIAVSSATAAWHLVVKALGIGPGDEVILPAITWPSMANIVELAGARAVFADVHPDTLQVDASDVARRINEHTRAVVPVHFAGAPCNVDALLSVIGARPIALIEDAAHALGTRYSGRDAGQRVGSSGRLALFSFHAIKNVTTGEGGLIACNDAGLAKRLRLLRFHGITRDTWARTQGGGTADFEILEPGYKYNMLDIQAAMGLHQLPKLARFNARRAALAARYDTLLAGLPWVQPLASAGLPEYHAHHLYVVRLNLAALGLGAAQGRDQFAQALARYHIGTGLHFPAVHLKQYYRERYGYSRADCPHAVALGESIVSLPLYPAMADEDVDDVVSAMVQVAQEVAHWEK
ncbi:MAG: hypothetical protein CFE32_13070 [Alphaproteobacteria bacterium PA3]|nr:MAG: hypothetical protein CFE32_13070 [Alphaproteobacteria bacterium PA3]